MNSGKYFTSDQFIAQFPYEVTFASQVWQQLQEQGFKPYAVGVFDFGFVSNKQESLATLKTLLTTRYDYTLSEPTLLNGLWRMVGVSHEFPIDGDNVLCWAIDLFIKGFECDCKLDGYGTFAGKKATDPIVLEPEKLAQYFDAALNAYQQENYAIAAINFNTAIRIFDTNPNAWYSRATVKDALYLFDQARVDYNQALQLAPSFKEAIINRAANYYNSGLFKEAIADFDAAIGLDAQDALLYYNRGNVKMQAGDSSGACADWKQALALGADYAADQLHSYCK
jgi:hypothetical protein